MRLESVTRDRDDAVARIEELSGKLAAAKQRAKDAESKLLDLAAGTDAGVVPASPAWLSI